MAGAPTGFTMNAKAELLRTISVRAEQCGQLTDRGVADDIRASGLYSTQNWAPQLGQRTFSSWLGISPPGPDAPESISPRRRFFLPPTAPLICCFVRPQEADQRPSCEDRMTCSTRNRNRLSVLFVDDDADVLEC